MSFIPARKMPHITANSGEFDPKTGKIVHLHPEASPSPVDRLPGASGLAKVPTLGWVAGGAGLAVALGVALFALRSSSAKTPTRRRGGTAGKRAPTTRRRRTTTKRKTAA